MKTEATGKNPLGKNVTSKWHLHMVCAMDDASIRAVREVEPVGDTL